MVGMSEAKERSEKGNGIVRPPSLLNQLATPFVDQILSHPSAFILPGPTEQEQESSPSLNAEIS